MKHTGTVEVGTRRWLVASAAALSLCMGVAALVPAMSNAEEIDAALAPAVVERDGLSVQRTPDSAKNYNIEFLNADERGCYSCHDDLTAIHDGYAIQSGLERRVLEMPLEGCMSCHGSHSDYVSTSGNLGTAVHTIHNGIVDSCWTCHVATNDGQGMQLWDSAKYTQLKGIVSVQDVQGEFSYSQDYTVSEDEFFSLSKNWAGAQNVGVDPNLTGEEMEQARQEVWDSWVFTVQGYGIDEPVSWTLDELIASFPSEDIIIKDHCAEEGLGGAMIAAVNARGIPLQAVFDAVGVDMTADYIVFDNITGMSAPVITERLVDTWLVYEIDGERLSWEQGYPLKVWTAGMAGPANTKQSTGFTFVKDGSEPFFIIKDGHVSTEDGEEVSWNKPSMALFDIYEGQIIETGQPFTFTGVTDSWTNRITAVDISMDNGQTWTTFETPDSTAQSWLVWEFTFTPEKDGAYVFSVRAHDEDGFVTPEPVKVLVNAKSPEAE